MKRQGETRMLLFIMTGMAFLFVAVVVPLSGISLFLVAQVVAIVLGGITIVSLFKRYRGLDLFSAASIFFLYILMVSLFSPGVVNALAAYLTRSGGYRGASRQGARSCLVHYRSASRSGFGRPEVHLRRCPLPSSLDVSHSTPCSSGCSCCCDLAIFDHA